MDWVVLECASCNDDKGLRIMRSVDDYFSWFGEEKGDAVEKKDRNDGLRGFINSIVVGN